MVPKSKRLLWSIRSQITSILVPELSTPAARNVASSVDLLLAELIAREDRTTGLLVAQIEDGLALVARGVQAWGDPELTNLAGQIPRGLGTEHNLTTLWGAYDKLCFVLAGLVTLANRDETPEARSFADDAAAWERTFVEKQAEPIEGQNLPPKEEFPPVTAELIEACLAENSVFPGVSKVTEFKSLSGGYSKAIFRFEVENSELGRFPLVLRRNESEPFDARGCFFQDNEYAMTTALYRAGVRLPQPFHFEPKGGLFGGETSIMGAASGRLYGDVLFANSDLTVAMVQDLAAVLAQLHTLTVEQLQPEIQVLGLSPEIKTIGQANAAMLEHHQAYWNRTRVTPSPLVARAFGWLQHNLPANDAPVRVVHGDFGLNNVLFDEGRVSAVLDWETMDIGDPASELAYLLDPLESQSLWEPFLEAYRAAGGQPADDASLRFHRAARWLRNVAFSSDGTGRYDSGAFDNFPLATLAVAVRPFFIRRADDFARDSA